MIAEPRGVLAFRDVPFFPRELAEQCQPLIDGRGRWWYWRWSDEPTLDASRAMNSHLREIENASARWILCPDGIPMDVLVRSLGACN